MRSFLVTDAVRDYSAAHSSWPPTQWCGDLQERTRALGGAAGMQIGDDQGQLLTMLTRLVGARSAVEVGTFTGYSSLCIARGLADGGRLVCCDISEEWTAIGRAGLAGGRGGATASTCASPPRSTRCGPCPPSATIDLVFIDADKGGYAGLLGRAGAAGAAGRPAAGRQRAVERRDRRRREVRRRPSTRSGPSTTLVAADDRVEVVMLTAFDGLTIARKL